jgi:hypothetical protein
VPTSPSSPGFHLKKGKTAPERPIIPVTSRPDTFIV